MEVTLPTDLRPMVGLPCRILLHDGAQPDIVLRPDMGVARAAFATLWRRLEFCLGGGPGREQGARWPDDQFIFILHPEARASLVPCLAWQDGLALAAGPADAAVCGRAASGLLSVLAAEWCVAPALAAGFGAACGFHISGAYLAADWHEPCDLAASALRDMNLPRPGAAFAAMPDWRCDALWQALHPGLRSLAELFARWSQPGSDYAELRGSWRRGRSIEFSQG